MTDIEIRHAHMFCGMGGGKKGFNHGSARVGNLRVKPRCIGGIDSDPAAIRKFNAMGPGRAGAVLDLFSLAQYRAFHGKEPPAGWRESMPADIHVALGNEHPHVWFLSAPCKGFSGLLSESRSLSPKYQALNQLTLRGIWLVLEAFKDDPVPVILFENVPRIATRGRHLLDQIVGLLRSYGYAVAETTHDCGEIGGLAQSRKRFLLIARHVEKVPPFIYEPKKQRLRAVGEVLSKLPLPGDPRVGVMHRMPALQWKTWVRLAFVEAGSDWRSLERLRVKDGVLMDYLLLPELYGGAYGVKGWGDTASTVTSKNQPSSGAASVADPRVETFKGGHGVLAWEETAGTIAGESFPTNGRFAVADPRPSKPADELHGKFHVTPFDEASRAVIAGRENGGCYVADPRIDGHPKSVQMGVRAWDQPAGVVTGKMFAGGGPNSVADPRIDRTGFANVYRVGRWDEVGPAVTAGAHPSSGGSSVADPRFPWANAHENKFRVTDWDDTAGTVIGTNKGPGSGAQSIADPRTGFGKATYHNVLHVTDWDDNSKTITSANHPSGGAQAVADPRPRLDPMRRENYLTGGHYGVIPWTRPANVVAGKARHDNGFNNVADPRIPAPEERLVALIIASDNTWHRPFTTLELGALQSLIDIDEWLATQQLLDLIAAGKYSDTEWREHIGNAVPPMAAGEMASVIYRALLGAMTGETFTLSSESVWVRDVAFALSVNVPV